MKQEVLLALIAKLVGDRLENEITSGRLRGPRGFKGVQGERGESAKDFVFEEHKEEIRKIVSEECKLTFADLSPEEIESLRGPRGRDGSQGPKGEDGTSFIFSEHQEAIYKLISDEISALSPSFKLSFSDLSEDEKNSLRGARGQRGKQGRDGKDFNFEEHREFFESLRPIVSEDDLNKIKLKFSDLSPEEIESLRGPRGLQGRQGRDGKDFIFEEHKEYFDSLKIKFSDFTDEEKTSLKLKFSDLTDEEKISLKGARGQRGRSGRDGKDGEIGPQGPQGPVGPMGLPGKDAIAKDGKNGKDGEDAPIITDIRFEEYPDHEIALRTEMSDGTFLETPKIKIPSRVVTSVQTILATSDSGGGSGTPGSQYYFGSGVPNNSLYLDGDIYQDTDNGDQYKKISGAWVLQDNVTGPAGTNGAEGSQYYFGSGVPNNALYSDGDIYQNTDNGDQYKKISGAWVYQATISGGGGGNEIVFNIPCDSSVFVGAAVRMSQNSVVELTMSQWTSLAALPAMDATTYSVQAVNAIATSWENSNVFGIVESKPTATTCNIRVSGISGAIFLGLDIVEEYYLSDQYAGQIVELSQAPTSVGTVLVRLGQPYTPDRFYYQRGDRILRA